MSQKYYKHWYKFSKQTNTSIPQQISFAGKLEAEDGATMFFSLKSSKKLLLTFL